MEHKRRFSKPMTGVLVIAVVLLALLAYGNSFPGAYILDDHIIVETNPLLLDIDLRTIFTSDYWGVEENSGLFRPVTILSLALNQQLLGHEVSGYHLVNLLLHAGVAAVFFMLLLRLNFSPGIAWLAAVLFAVHPIHTEVVNEVVGRAELLCALFVLLAVYPGVWRRRFSAGGGLIFLAVSAAALLAKENGIIIVVLLPLVDFFRGAWRDGQWRQCLKLYLLLLALVVAWLGWRSWGVVRIVPELPVEPAINPLAHMDAWSRLLTAIKIQGVYLAKLIWPAELFGVYSGTGWLTPATAGSALETVAILGSVVVLGAVGAVWGCARGLLFAWAMVFYLVSFLPTANLLFPIGVSMAERLAYQPSLWFCLAVAAAMSGLSNQKVHAGLAVILVMALLVTTWARNIHYSSEFSLWKADVDRDPENVMAWLYLSREFKNPVDAEAYFKVKLALVPGLPEAQSIYAEALYNVGRNDEAIELALQSEGRSGTSLVTNKFVLALAYLKKNQFHEALHWLERSKSKYGGSDVYWEVKGKALEGLGRFEEAIECYRQVYAPSATSDVYFRLGNLLLTQQKFAEAESVLRLDVQARDVAESWNALGVSLALQDKTAEALSAFQRAVSLEPGSEHYRENYHRFLGSE